MPQTVHVYAMNIDVEQHNLHMLEQATREAFVFRCKDSGNRTDLSHCLAIPTLTIKLNCPVILSDLAITETKHASKHQQTLQTRPTKHTK